jgi:hypothetical protein
MPDASRSTSGNLRPGPPWRAVLAWLGIAACALLYVVQLQDVPLTPDLDTDGYFSYARQLEDCLEIRENRRLSGYPAILAAATVAAQSPDYLAALAPTKPPPCWYSPDSASRRRRRSRSGSRCT